MRVQGSADAARRRSRAPAWFIGSVVGGTALAAAAAVALLRVRQKRAGAGGGGLGGSAFFSGGGSSTGLEKLMGGWKVRRPSQMAKWCFKQFTAR